MMSARWGCLAHSLDSTLICMRWSVTLYFIITLNCGFFVKAIQPGYPVSCNDHYVRIIATGTVPVDGIYTVNNDGNELSVYCDMTRDGGGWTLLFTMKTGDYFWVTLSLHRKSTPSLYKSYSILDVADYFKTNSTGDTMQYRIEANEPGRWGGIWQVPSTFTFASDQPNQVSTLVTKFDDWAEGNAESVGNIMPWKYDNSFGYGKILATKDVDLLGNKWGTLSCTSGCDCSPGCSISSAMWMNPEMQYPNAMWYWMKENRPPIELQCTEDTDPLEHWKQVSKEEEIQLAMSVLSPDATSMPWETSMNVLTIVTTYTSSDCGTTAADDLIIVYRLLKAISASDISSADTAIQPLIKNFINSASGLLKTKHRTEWVTASQFVGASSVMATIDEFAQKVSEALLPTDIVVVDAENIIFVVQMMNLSSTNTTGVEFTNNDEDWSVTISSDVFRDLLDIHGEGTKVAFIGVLYKNVSELLTNDVHGGAVYSEDDIITLGKSVISATVRINGDLISVPVDYRLPVDPVDDVAGPYDLKSACVFLEYKHDAIYGNGQNTWSSEGCDVTHSTGVFIECHCNHTTNFAVLMQVVPFEIPERHFVVLRYITYTGCSISIVAMCATLGLYSYLRTLLPAERISIHKNLILAIMLSHLVSMATESASQVEVACKIFAVLLHYTCTAMFLWMLAEGIHLYRQIVAVYGSERSWMNYYYTMAWGTPFLIVAITAGIRIEDYGAVNHCWLSVESGLIWAFVGPAILIMTGNLVVLIMVVRVVVSASHASGQKQNDHVKAGVKSSLLLLPLLGITWCFGLFATGEETIAFLYIFSILNSLQGLFIFLFHVVYNSEVRAALRRKKEKFEAERGQFGTSTNATAGSWYTRSTMASRSTRVTRMSSEQTLHLEDVVNDVKMVEDAKLSEPPKKLTTNENQTPTARSSRNSLIVHPNESTMALRKCSVETISRQPRVRPLVLRQPRERPNTLNRPEEGDMW